MTFSNPRKEVLAIVPVEAPHARSARRDREPQGGNEQEEEEKGQLEEEAK